MKKGHTDMALLPRCGPLGYSESNQFGSGAAEVGRRLAADRERVDERDEVGAVDDAIG